MMSTLAVVVGSASHQRHNWDLIRNGGVASFRLARYPLSKLEESTADAKAVAFLDRRLGVKSFLLLSQSEVLVSCGEPT